MLQNANSSNPEIQAHFVTRGQREPHYSKEMSEEKDAEENPSHEDDLEDDAQMMNIISI